ncbi:hypothetical protein [Rubrobacter aplysinae]|uniref:hypothetical protein n=1 Tax=Rubrobacter aplysinae TaxID=909625 RepID=UPI00064BFB2B|nr:hypothetical protein [Rubrobacter aplysinae]
MVGRTSGAEVGADATDRELLRRYEPALRFTKGERFYPMDVEPYVEACALWVERPGEEAVRAASRGKLNLERLAQQPDDEFGAVHYLIVTDSAGEGNRSRRDQTLRPWLDHRKSLARHRKLFRPGRGRLARVGYVSRFADALYSLALLARGRVPGEAVEEALDTYRRAMHEDEHYRYHGRVVRQNGWIVLQYWLFYAFNDWRSGYYGANDHEADWEKVFVYLSRTESGGVVPEWAAYSAHNETGDDLRRRWDDPELETVDDHPVVYVCSGSHASRYVRGEYLTELEIRPPKPLARLRDAAEKVWNDALRQYTDRDPLKRFSIPFVDYARGDGLTVGPGGDHEWDEPRVMGDPPPGWVSEYRGLWGLYTRDPFEGEDAPAGPMYDRDKGISREWYDPVGWAGLDKVPTIGEEAATISHRMEEIRARREAARAEIETKDRELKRLGMEAAAMRDLSHLEDPYRLRRERIQALSSEARGLREEVATGELVEGSLARHAERLRRGERGPVDVHVANPQRPASEVQIKAGRIAELWAAVSVGLMLIVLVVVATYQRDHILVALVLSFSLFAFVEAGFRGRLTSLVGSANAGLAVVAALLLLYQFFWEIVVFAVLAIGLYILWDNLREFVR